jgi:arginine decarboxylase
MSMPGERLGGPNTPVIKLILAMEEFGKRFPGFEREVHGIEVDAEGCYWMRGVLEEPATEKKPQAFQPPADEETPSVEPAAHSRLESKPIRRSTS